MIPLFLDMGVAELLVIVVLAMLLLGPDKVPDLGRKAARVFQYVRRIANTATDQIKAELGPEFADLTPSDLTPAKLMQRVIPEEFQSEMDAMKAELAGMRAQMDSLRQQTADQVQESTASLGSLDLQTTGRGWLGALTAPEPTSHGAGNDDGEGNPADDGHALEPAPTAETGTTAGVDGREG